MKAMTLESRTKKPATAPQSLVLPISGNETPSSQASETTFTAPRFGHDFANLSVHPLALQTKLTVNEPGDKFEQQADRIAERVMRMSDAEVAVQRQCAKCDEEENKKLHRKEVATVDVAGASAPAIVQEAINSSGQSLNADTRAFFEPRFGCDLSGVRIHNDAKAAESAKSVSARAFTVGNHIAFGRGESPDRDRQLLAHELAHVLQQSRRGMQVQRSSLPFQSTIDIRHRILKSRGFRVKENGLIVTINAGWEPGEEWRGEEHPKCGNEYLNVELRSNDNWVFKGMGSCDFEFGSPTTRQWLGIPSGEYHLIISTGNTNPYCRIEGGIVVAEQSGLSGESCTQLPPGPMEIIHTSLDAAVVIPALGVIPDALNLGIYSIEGDWKNAGFSAAAMVPFLGDAATVGKAIRRGRDALKINERGVGKVGAHGITDAAKRAKSLGQAEELAAKKTAQSLKLIEKLAIPKAVPYKQTVAALDPELTKLARELRATQAGVSKDAFKQNIATARIRVDGEVRYISAGNAPSSAHSEEFLHAQIDQIRRQNGGKKVTLVQLYTERIPCGEHCGPLLSGNYPGAEVFFTTRNRGAAAQHDLMHAYGLVP